MQLNHYTSKFKTQQFPITLVCDNVTNAPNIGSLFRICDAFGVEQIIFCGEPISIGRKVTKTSRATEKAIKYSHHNNIESIIEELKSTNHQIIALEITATSKPLHSFKFQPNQPIAIVIGDENFGISECILKKADEVIHIEMFGQNSSMNVVQATNLALYEITKQLMS
jgi:tRNA G18 (ribose-2'-O)-methylase SpoU